ncbi:LysR family transcriptional regulator [Novosphingobium pokkalii]|uniref:LysR family transcriptional regulator n=1 Tax=Novosphingobium pokkalii TaxID=1770194 RepID=A0ABV7V8Z7_9SPHN|nr:LysR family transcriptional regulator [Novosphingobium pokkalii]GHC96296.1 LysR family transcriptional regulator [Novosphingobium pokkalii]
MRLPAEFDLHGLEVFVLTVELGGMTACAQQLRITQSAVSQTITRLEQGIGAPLFDRSLRPLGLTPSGRALHERARKLLANARTAYDEVREGAQQPIDQLTVGMSESLANLLTAPLLRRHGMRVGSWRVRSGISLRQQQEFLARRCDMLVTGSNTLEKHPGIEHHDVIDDPFVMIFPADHNGSIDPADVAERMPFVRYSLDTGMGQRIESQLTRMKLRLPNVIEVEIIHQQLTTVGMGIGWSITSLLCLAALPQLMPQLRVEPLPRGRFARRIQVVARMGELGDLPGQTAALARETLLDQVLPPLITTLPWAGPLLG